MPLTEKGEKILENMEETYGSERKAKSVLYASKNAGKISGIDQGPLPSSMPTASIAPNAGSPTAASATPPPTPSSPVTGDDDNTDGPKGVLKPIGEMPEEKAIKSNNPGGPSGTPDAAETKEGEWPPIPKKPILGSTAPKPGRIKTAYGWAGKDEPGQRNLAKDRPPDKAVGTLRDYAAAAGAKR
jgi:hypothetical protein